MEQVKVVHVETFKHQCEDPDAYLGLWVGRINDRRWLGYSPGELLCSTIVYKREQVATWPPTFEFRAEFTRYEELPAFLRGRVYPPEDFGTLLASASAPIS